MCTFTYVYVYLYTHVYVYFLRYIRYYVLVSYEVGTENTKTLIKQKHFFKKIAGSIFQQLFFKVCK